MTNADKYLKDGVDVGELAKEIFNAYELGSSSKVGNILNFFARESKLTLSEDEKVILRNINEKYTVIFRDGAGLLEVKYKGGGIWIQWGLPYQHLFQFIKERRRI